MLELLSDPNAWITLLTLSALEIVLGIDNIIFISILVGRLPESQRERARIMGLGLAMFSRIALLFSIVWLTRLTKPWFSVLGHPFSGRDLILLVGGLFLLVKSVLEIHHTMEGREGQPRGAAVLDLLRDRDADRDHRHRVLAGLGVHGGRPGRARPGADHGRLDRHRHAS